MRKASEIITKEEIEKIRPFIPDVDDYMEKDLRELVIELGYAITSEMDKNYELTPTSRMLERLTDDLLWRESHKSDD